MYRLRSPRCALPIRVYDADNHLFFPGTGTSTPADYAAPQHVDPAVVDGIAQWLAPRRRRFSLFKRVIPENFKR